MSLLYYKQKLLSTSVDGRKSSSLQKFCRILSTAAQITIHRVKSDRKTAKNFSAKKPKNRQNLCVFCCPLHLAIARRGVCLYAWRLPVAVCRLPGVCPLRSLPLCLAIARRGVSLAWRLPVAVSACLAFARCGVSFAWRLPAVFLFFGHDGRKNCPKPQENGFGQR